MKLQTPNLPTGQAGFKLRTLAVLALVLSLASCFEPKMGCLDIAATNFDAAADESCCCEYPQLVLEVEQQYDTLLFRPDSLYPGNGNHLFRIKSIAFYLSDFQLSQNGNLFIVSDTISLRTFSITGSDTLTEIFTDDFLLLRRAPVDNPAGTFRQDGIFQEVKFRLGLSAKANRVIAPLTPTGHPLQVQSDSLWQGRGAGYVFLQAVVVRDSINATPPDTLSFTQADFQDFFVDETGSFFHPTGYDFRLKLTADWKRLFEGVNWPGGDISSWKAQIVANLPNVFSVSQ